MEWSSHTTRSPPRCSRLLLLTATHTHLPTPPPSHRLSVHLQTHHLGAGEGHEYSTGSTVYYYAAKINVCPLYVNTLLISLLLYQPLLLLHCTLMMWSGEMTMERRSVMEGGGGNLEMQRGRKKVFRLFHAHLGSPALAVWQWDCCPLYTMLTMNKLKIKHLDSSRVKQLPQRRMPNKY